MRKVLSLVLVVVLIFSLTACRGRSVSDEALEKMEQEIVNKDYDKALAYIEIALEDEKLEQRERVLTLKSILKDYLLAVDYFEENDLELSKSILDNIDPNYNNYAIKEDIELLREAIELKESEIGYDEKLKEFERLVSERSLEDARDFYNSIVNEDFNDEQRVSLEEIGQKLIDRENIAKEERKKETELKTKKTEKESEVKSDKGNTGKPYTGEDSWKNYNHKRPDHVNKRIEENKRRSKERRK